MGNTLIAIGVFVALVGIVLNIVGKFSLPILPGDIFIKNDHLTVYFPIVTSILVSILLTILFNLFR